MEKNRGKGFTLVELMVTISVLAILAAIAVPSYRAFILNNALSSATSDLRSAIARARQEAITRGTFVSIIPKSTSARGSAWNWLTGFTMFVNPSNGATFATAGTLGTGTDQFVAIELQNTSTALDSPVTVYSNEVILTFRSDGTTALPSGTPGNQTIRLCVDPTVIATDYMREISVDRVGRTVVTKASTGTC